MTLLAHCSHGAEGFPCGLRVLPMRRRRGFSDILLFALAAVARGGSLASSGGLLADGSLLAYSLTALMDRARTRSRESRGGSAGSLDATTLGKPRPGGGFMKMETLRMALQAVPGEQRSFPPPLTIRPPSAATKATEGYIYPPFFARGGKKPDAIQGTATTNPSAADAISEAVFKRLEWEAQFREQLRKQMEMPLQNSTGDVGSWPPVAMESLDESDLLATDLVKEVHSEEDLDESLQHASGLVVMEIVTSWCRTCRSFVPKYKRLAGAYDGRVKFLKITANENDSTNRVAKERFATKATPSFIFFRHGKVVATQRGANLSELQSKLDTA